MQHPHQIFSCILSQTSENFNPDKFEIVSSVFRNQFNAYRKAKSSLIGCLKKFDGMQETSNDKLWPCNAKLHRSVNSLHRKCRCSGVDSTHTILTFWLYRKFNTLWTHWLLYYIHRAGSKQTLHTSKFSGWLEKTNHRVIKILFCLQA